MPDMPQEQQEHPAELLPWFVNETLSTEERYAVEQHIATCPQCQQEIALLQEMRSHVKGTRSESPGEFGLNRLLSTVRNDRSVTEVPEQSSSPWWKTGFAIAASLIIFIQAGLLIDTWYLSKPVVPLTGPQPQGLVLQVSFTPTTTEAQIREIITAIHGRFIDGPSSLGIYRIRLDDTETSHASTIEHAIQHLRQKTEIILHVTQE